MTSLNINIPGSQYQAMLGVGGIGTRAFFALNGYHTLGREESRSGHFIDRQDHCKLHIISHYVKALLGEEFVTLPIGKVGDDEAGRHLLLEMAAAGLDLRYVQSLPGAQTLYSFCFIYPDGSGVNLATDNSACDQLKPEDVARAEADFFHYQARGVALAAPEVPLDARRKLLQLATQSHFFRVAAFNSAEVVTAVDMGMLAQTDLLALNQDEAAAVAGIRSDDGSSRSIVEATLARLQAVNSTLQVTITAGKGGSWSWNGKNLRHVPAFPTQMVSTAGAGDAFLAGMIAGLATNLSLPHAQELGTLVAALSVTSPHTINSEIERQSLRSFSSKFKLDLSEPVKRLLQD
ncbi:MAG: PfkB family carbohydrate kinase [Anaerolineales bacterium]